MTARDFIRHLRAALRGEEHEYTSGSIKKAIFMLSVPMIAEMIMESLFAVVDLFFVSRVSATSVAVVGMTESVMMILFSIAVGMSMATTAIVARRVGEKHFKRAADAAFQSIVLGVGVGVILGFLGFIFAGDILRIMGGKPDLIEEGINYTRIMYAGNLSALLLFLINAIFRGAGNASIAMRSLWLANGMNMLLDPIFIFGFSFIPEFGVAGAAIATTSGRMIGVLFQLYHLLNGSAIIKLTKDNMVMRWKTIKELIYVSSSGIAQFLIETASWIFIYRIMATFGDEVLAGYTIVFRVVMFTILPSWGFANASATLVGQNLGAEKPDRAEQSVWTTAKLNTIVMVIVAVLLFVFSSEITHIFRTEETVLFVGDIGLKIISLGFVFFSFGMIIGQAFNGAGDTRTPMWISLLVFWPIQIPMAWILAVYLGWESVGVFISISISHSIYAVIATYLFRKGRWKLVKV